MPVPAGASLDAHMDAHEVDHARACTGAEQTDGHTSRELVDSVDTVSLLVITAEIGRAHV